MRIPFQLPDSTAGPALVLERSFWTGRTRLFADNQELRPQATKGLLTPALEYHVPLPDGRHQALFIHNRLYDPVPRAYTNGQAIELARPLKAWEYVVAGLPLLLVFGGGLLGGGVGMGALLINLSIMRSNRPAAVRVALCLGMLLLAVLALGLLYNLVTT